jgi:hypothetical protein
MPVILGGNTGIYLASLAPPAPSLLLDIYPSAAVAYSLRKLRSAYTGNAIRVRRSSDNTEQNIGFVNNVLDTASLLTFCGVGNGFVTTWYDQSTNANNSTQATAVNQCQIVSSGAIITDVTTGKITTTWTTDRYTLATGIDPNTKYLSIGVVNRTANTNSILHIGVAGTFGGTNGQTPLGWFATTGEVRSAMFSSFIHGINTSTGAFITTSEKNASDLKTVYLNGTALALTAIQAPSTGTNINSFGQSGGNYTTCQYQEYIYWNIEQSANRVAIETEINDYYNVY